MSLKLILGLLCLAAFRANGSPPLQLEIQAGLPYESEFIKTRAETRFRLPETLVPSHYELDIIPILDVSMGAERQFTAPGTVTIHVRCTASTNSITLHSQNITFSASSVTIATSTGTAPAVQAVNLDANDIAIITLNGDLVQDQLYTIRIDFVSQVSSGLDGLYQSFYSDETNTKKYLATTQFEKTGARKVFPCFDEPALRATFDIRIGRRNDNGYHSLCNTDKINTEVVPISGFPATWEFDVYRTTVIMPTYLIAIIVSDFTSELAPADLFRLPVKTWGPPNQMGGGSAEFSAQVAAKLLDYFEKYFEIDYPLSKLDSVAIPQFEAGAMENWGLNTYRIPLMLFFNGESTQFEQWRQAAVISHEVSHHWFGDLVTMNWWNDLWLKEGFARYLQFLGVESAEPQLEALNRVVVDTIQIAMENDILSTSHPIRGSWTTDIQDQSSRIIYEKGASLIRMMQGFLTEETLSKALRQYLNDFAYGSAIQDQLFAILTTHAHADGRLPQAVSVKDIMDSWTLQSGFPVIRVARASKTRVYFTQAAFSPVVANDGYAPVGTWEIPVTYATADQPDFSDANWNPKFWIHSDVLLVSQVVEDADKWIIVNPDARSYYRVLYDDHFENLIKAQLELKYDIISPSSRSQLLDDYFASAYNSHIGIERALDFTKYLHNEDKLVVWTTALLQLRKAYILLTDTAAISDFKAYVGTKILPQLEAIGGNMDPSEPPIRSMLRTQLLDWACSVGLDICFDTALPLIQEWIDATPPANPIAADIQPMIYCGAFSKGDATLRDFIKQQYFNANLSIRNRGLLLNALACGLESESLEAALTMALDSENGMSTADRKTLIEKVAGNAVSRPRILSFLADNKTAIKTLAGEEAIGSTITVLSAYFNTNEHITQLETFIAANGDLSEETVTSIKTSIDKIRTNQDWISKHYQAIENWLTTVKPAPNN